MDDENITFQSYFSGKMNSAQMNDFTSALANNSELKERYNFFLAAKKSASLIERDKMREALAGIEIKEEIADKVASKSATPILMMAKWVAGIAAFLLISFWTVNTLNPNGSQGIYTQNFQTYQVQATRGGSSDALKELYSEGKYEIFIAEAIKAEESPELNMMLANAYLNIDKYKEAIESLTKISDDSSLRDQKYWYLGLTYLKQTNLEESRKNFNKLLSLSNYKKSETEKILSKIGEK